MIEHGEGAGFGSGAFHLQGCLTRRTRRSIVRPIVAASLLASMAGAIAVAGTAAAAQLPSTGASASRLVAVSAAPRLPLGARVLGYVATNTEESAAIALRLPNPGAVTRFIDATADPRSSQYHHYLARGQFGRVFGPSTATIESVKHELAVEGLTVTTVSSNGLLVSFRGTAAKMETAFHTGLVRVRMTDGSIGQATTTAARLPASIAGSVQAVVGLDQLVKWSNGLERVRGHSVGRTPASAPRTTANGPVACSAAAALEADGALTDQQVASSYGLDNLYNAGDTAAGQTVDIYELEPFLQSDVVSFDTCYFNASHTPKDTVISVDGGPGAGPGGGEAALDVDDVSAFAPEATIKVYSGPNMDNPFGPLDTWNAIAVADDAGQVTSSWGVCETEEQVGAPGVQQVENEIFQQTAAQGQTIFSSAGDDGSDDCAGHATVPVATDLSLDDPASQPYVTSVGGTTITEASNPPMETVWNNGNFGGAGGGGISETWAMPPWQAKVAVAQPSSDEACSNDPSGTADLFHLQGDPTNLPSGTACRETPDVSALADPQTGITIFYDGSWLQIGGTSSSTPMWAAMLAEISASTGCDATTPPNRAGFVDPLLYQIADLGGASYSDAFNDITVGDNDNLSVGNGAIDWPAGTGYDLASGLGTPRITDATASTGLAAELCGLASGSATPARPVVTSLSSAGGSIDGGGTLTITGDNFGANEGSVFFGNVDASVPSPSDWTNTSITVDIPPYEAPPGTPECGGGHNTPCAGGSANITVVTSGAAPESSTPAAGGASVYHYTASSPSGGPIVDYVSGGVGTSTGVNGPVGPTAGSNDVEIVGSGLSGATSVTFGTATATIIASPSNSDNELEVEVPASNGTCVFTVAEEGMCAVAVAVTTPKGTSSGPPILEAYQGPVTFAASGAFVPPAGCDCEVVQAPEEYDYAPVPTVSSVSPAFASEQGDSEVAIAGTGFNLLSWFWTNVGPAGENFSEDFSIAGVTPTELDMILPGQAPTNGPDSVDLTVQTGGGLSALSHVVYAGVPVVKRLSTHVIAQTGGSLTVTGSGLSDVTSVEVAGQGSLNFLSDTTSSITHETATSLTVQVPHFFNIATDVLLCTVTACSSANPTVDGLQFAYAGQPVINSLGPSSGPAHGGETVTINGALDALVTKVDFGATPVTILSQPQFSPSGPIIVIAPAGTAGSKVAVTVTTVGGSLVGKPTSAPVTFTYVASTPGAPRDVAAKAGTRTATVTWKAPSDNGGDPISGYLITGTAPKEKSVSMSVAGTVLKATFTKLAAKVAWTFTVRAKNKLGTGLAASAKPVTPS